MKNIRVTNLGQIKEADINFGDLTLFVGPQATGKSILLQLIKLLLDSQDIVNNLNNNGYDWEENTDEFYELYFGEGMNNIWNNKTEIYLDETKFDSGDLASDSDFYYGQQLFLVPAQRVIALENGWPRPFTSFDIGDPYVVRYFSESLRLTIQKSYINYDTHEEIKKAIENSIFHGALIEVIVTGMRKRIHLNIDGNSFPFMTWSAGQREFMPLLLSFYWLNSTPNDDLEWVVIEEPEMGLHPQAILCVILMCLELLNQGYKLIISTHSPVLLEAVWAIRFLQQENSDAKYLYQLFNLESSESMTELFENILKNKTFSTYYFDQQKDGVYVKDISSLDLGDLDDAIAEWGGLTSFSSRASEVVSQAAQEKA
jgi:predicted ATP-dependent endonuclease of OLD family